MSSVVAHDFKERWKLNMKGVKHRLGNFFFSVAGDSTFRFSSTGSTLMPALATSCLAYYE
jgi:hypothetical protein